MLDPRNLPTLRPVLGALAVLAVGAVLLNRATADVAATTADAPPTACPDAERWIVYDLGLRARFTLWTADAETRVELPEVGARGVCVADGAALAAGGLALEPDPIMETLPILAQDAGAARAPDPRYQWHLTTVQAPRAWDFGQGAGVTVAIIDTGTDCSHPGLRDRCIDGTDYVGGRPCRVGLNCDGHSHGSHVAGLVAEVLDGHEGSGVAPLARIRPMRVLGDSGWGDTASIARAILDSANAGDAVINMSLGGPDGSTALRDAVAYAGQRGAIVVVARGNGGGESRSYPVCYEPTVGVAATDPQDRRAAFSDYGPCTDTAAPGTLLLSTLPGGRYGSMSGTSMASPVTAGVLALLVGLGDRDPVGTLLRTHAPVGDGLPGRVDALAAVLAAEPGPTVTPGPIPTEPPPPTAAPTFDPYPGRTATAAARTATATRAAATASPTPTRTPTRAAPTPTAPRPVQCEDLGLCEGRGGLLGTRRLCGPCGG